MIEALKGIPLKRYIFENNKLSIIIFVLANEAFLEDYGDGVIDLWTDVSQEVKLWDSD